MDNRRKLQIVSAANPSLRLSVAPPAIQPRISGVTTAPAQRLQLQSGQTFDRSPNAQVRKARDLPQLNFSQRLRDTLDANTQSDRIKRLNAGQNEIYTKGNAAAQAGQLFLGGFDKTRTAIDALTGHLDREAAALDRAYANKQISTEQYRLALQKQAERTAFAGTGYNKDGTKQGFGSRLQIAGGVGIEGGLNAIPFVGTGFKVAGVGGKKAIGSAVNAVKNPSIVKTGAKIGSGYGGAAGFAQSQQGGDSTLKKTALETGIGAIGGGVVGTAGGFVSKGINALIPKKPLDQTISKYLAKETDESVIGQVLSQALGVDGADVAALSKNIAQQSSKRGVNKSVKDFLAEYVPLKSFAGANDELAKNLATVQDSRIVKETIDTTHPGLSDKARAGLISRVSKETDAAKIAKLLDAADTVAKTTPKPTPSASKPAIPITAETKSTSYEQLAKEAEDLRAIPEATRTAEQSARLNNIVKEINNTPEPSTTPVSPQAGQLSPEELNVLADAQTGTGNLQAATAKATGEKPAPATPADPISSDAADVTKQISDAAVKTTDGRTPTDLITQAQGQRDQFLATVQQAAQEVGGTISDKSIKNAVKVNVERIAQKVKAKAGSPPTDLLRTTIELPNPAGELERVIQTFKNLGYTIWNNDITNRYTLPGTYKDIALKFVSGGDDPIVKEVQLISPNMAAAKNEWGGHKLYKQVRAKVGDFVKAEQDMNALYAKADELDRAAYSASDTSVPSSARPSSNGSPDAVYPATSSPSNTTLTGTPSTTKNLGNGADINSPLSPPSILKKQGDVKNISDQSRPAGFATQLSQTETPEAVYSDLLQITTKPNPQTFAQASQDIASNEQAVLADILSKNKGTLNDVDNARALILLDKAIAEDNIPLATQIAGKVNSSGTENARAVQILSAIDKTTPTGAFKEAQKIVTEAQEKGFLPKDYVIPQEKLASINEKAKAIQGLEMGSREHEIAVAVLVKDLKSIVPPKIGDKLNSLVNISLLLNPKTFVRNVIGNVAGATAETASTAVATPIDMLAALRTGNRTVALPSLLKRFGGFGTGLKQGAQETELGIRIGTGGKYDINPAVFTNRYIARIEKTLGHSLSDLDKAFAKSQFEDTLNSLMKAQKVSKPTQEMLDIAEQEGLYATYQGDSFIAKSLQGAKGWLNKANIKGFGLGDVVIRYPKTPGNLVAVGMDYSPYGFVKGLVQFAKLNEQSGLAAQRAAVRNLGRGITGSGLIAGGYYLAQNGIITAKKSSDKDLNSLQRQQGQPPFSFNITALGRLLRGEDTKAREGDVISTYDWLQPNAIQLSMGANMALNKDKGASDWISTTLDQAATGLETVQEQPVIATTGRFFKTAATPVDQGGGIPNALIDATTGLPSMFVPSISNQAAGVADNTARTTYDPNPVKMGFNKVVAKIPGASKTLEPVIDTFGNEVKRQQTDNPITKIFNSFVNPAFVTKIQRTPEGQMVLDIYNNTGETSQVPRVAAKTQQINKDGGEGSKAESYTLSSKELTEFQKVTGDLAKKTFGELAKNPAFMALGDEEKAKVMSDKLTDINAYAKVKVLGNKPKTQSQGLKALMSGNVGQFSSKTPEGISGNAKKYYDKVAYMDDKTLKEYLKGQPDDVAQATAKDLNSRKIPGINDLPASNKLAKLYAEYSKSKAQAIKDGNWSKLDEQKKTKEFWKAAVKDSKDPLAKDVYDNGTKDIEQYIKDGWITKADLDAAIALDNELYGSDLTSDLKFGKKFRNKYGYGIPSKVDAAKQAAKSGGGKGGKGKAGKSVAGLGELKLRFNPPDAPDVTAKPNRSKAKFKFNVPGSVQVTPVRLKL